MGHCMFLRKGETHTVPLSGILASDIAVGSTVKLMENGTAVDYLVVNQGIPSDSSLYDASCDGTWLLRKDACGTRAFNTGTGNKYKNMSNYLNNTFFVLLGEMEQSVVKQVKIPYVNGTGGSSVASGETGLDTKVFLLGGYEVGLTTSNNYYFPVDGAKLNYFEEGDTSGSTNRTKRIAYLDGTLSSWWLRSPYNSGSSAAFYIDSGGSYNYDNYAATKGIRPALILPSTALFDKTTLILKGVA